MIDVCLFSTPRNLQTATTDGDDELAQGLLLHGVSLLSGAQPQLQELSCLRFTYANLS